jgi:predicted transposase YbfD/YdcC
MAQTTAQQDIPISCAATIENVHSRFVRRECRVFAVPEPIQKHWQGLKTFVVVQRSGLRDGQPFDECQFYICSQSLSAQQLLADTQGHWGIENRLHWVKDVTFAEDFPPRTGGNAPVNWAILHSFFITIARSLGFRTIPQAQRALANQLPKVFSILV